MQIKSRQPYLDTFYVNGVPSIVNPNKEGIRALTDDEKQWLDTFYRQDLCASWTDEETGIKDEIQLTDVLLELATIREELKKMNRRKVEWKPSDVDKARILYDRSYELKEEVRSLDRKKDSYSRNNDRNACIYNIARKTGNLTYIEDTALEDVITGSYTMDFDIEE